MMTLIRELWADRRGETNIISALLLCVIISIGAIVGLSTLRAQIVQQFGDMALALENLNQSFTSSLGTYTDTSPPKPILDPPGSEPAGLDVGAAASVE